MASRVQMMSKAFMNGEVKKDAYGANKAKIKEQSPTPGKWGGKKENSPSHKTNDQKDTTAGSRTPTLGRKVNSNKCDGSPSFARKLDSQFTSNAKIQLGNVGQETKKNQMKESNNAENIHAKDSMVSLAHSKDKQKSPLKDIGGPKESPKASRHQIKTDNVRPSSGSKDASKDSLTSASKSSPQVETKGVTKDTECETPTNKDKTNGKEGKPTRFAMRKQKRAKRHRSDGYMLALEMATNSSEDESISSDPSLGDAINFLQWIRNPTLQNLAKLRRAIKNNDKDWMKEFLEFDGLGLLFQCLKDLTAIQGFHLTDMVLKMECIMCIREVVNSQTGLDCLLQIKGKKDNIFGRRFASALETKNLMVKMQIFELLSALCVYSKDGYYLTLDALERYRSWQKLQYRMSVLVNEVRKSELTTYKTTIMALVNAIIFANENIRDRVRMRNEFLALNLLDTIASLRCEDDEDLLVQCDVFEEELHADTDALEESKTGQVNLNDPQSVFSGVYKKVQGTPLNATLLGILHSLLQIEPHSTQSESIWTLVERLTQEAINGDSNRDCDLILKKMKNTPRKDQEIQTDSFDNKSELQRAQASPAIPAPPPLPSGFNVPQAPPLPGHLHPKNPPPAPPLHGIPIAPPPPLHPSTAHTAPPPPSGIVPGVPIAPPVPCALTGHPIPIPPPAVPPPPPGVPGAPLPPPPPFGVPGAPPPPPGPGGPPPPPGAATVAGVAVQSSEPVPKGIETPNPTKKMRTLTWNKIPAYAFKKESVWSEVLNMRDSIDVDYNKFEEMFSQKETESPKTLAAPEGDKGLARRHSTHNQEVTLLDPKKSMNLNIFLKQFRKPNEVIIELIKAGDVRGLGVEKLKGLLKLLPQQDEIEAIQSYEGEIDKLGNAEKFFHELIQLPDFKLRIEMMLLKGDFNSQIGSVRPNIQVLTSVVRKLMDNESLKVFLRFVLHAGNFLNKGSSSGGAIGFRISSLNKLLMTKSNTAKMSLLHYLVEEAQEKNKEALSFVDELLEPLQKASRFTLDGMLAEFETLKSNVNRLRGTLDGADEEVKAQFSGFVSEAEEDIKDVSEAVERVQKLSSKLAVHYCENEKSFKIDEFLEAFRDFCEKVKSCEQELETWKLDAEKAEMRRKNQADLAEKRKTGHGSSLKEPQDRKIVDNIVNEIRKGKVLRRLSMRRKVTDSEIEAAGKKT